MAEAEEEILAHMDFPHEHWRQLSSTNPLERLNKEIARRTRVVGIFPTPASLIRLAGSLLAEQSDEWAVSRRYMPRRQRSWERSSPIPYLSLSTDDHDHVSQEGSYS